MKKQFAFVFAFFAIASLSACVAPMQNEKHTTVTGITGNYGVINGIPDKIYETKGLIFVTVAMDDSYPNTSEYDKSIVADELMKKAHAMGADDIVNIRIYRKDVRITDNSQETNILARVDPREKEKHTYEYHASAMAIKYTGTVLNDVHGQWILKDDGKIIGREGIRHEDIKPAAVPPANPAPAMPAKARRAAQK